MAFYSKPERQPRTVRLFPEDDSCSHDNAKNLSPAGTSRRTSPMASTRSQELSLHLSNHPAGHRSLQVSGRLERWIQEICLLVEMLHMAEERLHVSPGGAYVARYAHPEHPNEVPKADDVYGRSDPASSTRTVLSIPMLAVITFLDGSAECLASPTPCWLHRGWSNARQLFLCSHMNTECFQRFGRPVNLLLLAMVTSGCWCLKAEGSAEQAATAELPQVLWTDTSILEVLQILWFSISF
ncbi:hypothetical protein Anapl_11027 [Anas platyrhynchos]|uniref:Uncharacterized protein n=1 Tax=Anas platyrhynchos TaxID=8839 RepID=R0LXZ5_ANAPL|nr:hypothetical protein Anapl_11027 [Anas platyrhynchos]